MLAPSVRDLAAHLDGEVSLWEERCDELVEFIMIGGFFLDPGDYVFSRREQKAVIVRADRPDLQMAALRTSTACLVLTGGQNPIQYVTYHAQQEEVPVVLVQSPTLQAMERLHTLAQRVTVHNPRKVERFHQLLDQHCGLPALYSALGLN
jgi:BioD-like phosphotransacetylase family protein